MSRRIVQVFLYTLAIYVVLIMLVHGPILLAYLAAIGFNATDIAPLFVSVVSNSFQFSGSLLPYALVASAFGLATALVVRRVNPDGSRWAVLAALTSVVATLLAARVYGRGEVIGVGVDASQPVIASVLVITSILLSGYVIYRCRGIYKQ